MPVRSPRTLYPFVLGGLLALSQAPIQAQVQDGGWSSLQPPGGVDPANVSTSANLVLYRDGSYLRVYSPVTGAWHAFTPSFGTTPRLADDLLLIPESDRWTAFSAYRGVFETLLVNRTGAVEEMSDSLFVVREGSTAHVFSAFTGRWHSRAVPSSWRMELQDRVVVFFDGQYLANTFAGASVFDAYAGQWHDVPARTETFLGVSAQGGTALFGFGTEMLGFSAQLGRIESLPAPSPAQRRGFSSTQPGGDAVVRSGTVFSGATGRASGSPFILPPTFGNSPLFAVHGLVATAFQSNQPTFAAGFDGVWTPWPASNQVLNGPGSVALMVDGTQLHAFSAVTGAMATTTAGQVSPYTRQIRRHVIALEDDVTGMPLVFSGLTGLWHPVPGDVVADTDPFSTNIHAGSTSALLRTTSGWTAFSARTGTYYPLIGNGLQPVTGWSAAVGAVDATALHCFDAVRERWLQVPMNAPAAMVAQSGARSSTLLAEEPGRVVAFAARIGRFGALPLAEPLLDRGVRGDMAWVRTANALHAFSGLGEHAVWSGFPEDLRACGMGTDLRHQLRLAPGDSAITGYGPRAVTPWSVPGLGDIWLEPALAALELVTGPVAGESRVERALPIPVIPALRGSEWFFQSLVVPMSGAPRLTEPTAFRIY